MLAVVLLTATAARAEELSFFRGDRGIARGEGALPDDLSMPGTVGWRQEVGAGHSSPCVTATAIYLTTFDGEKELATVALERATGKQLWKQVCPNERIEPYHPTSSPAAATPACDGKRVFSFFGSYGLMCYDLDGKRLWSRQMGPFRDEFGSGSSPVLVDGKVILCEDHDVDSFLMAIDAATGDIVWKTPRDFTRSYSTPIVWETGGKKQIIVSGALQLVAYDPANGERLWWMNGFARIVNTTPVRNGDLLYCSTWSPGGDTDARIGMEPFDMALKTYDKNNNQKISEDELPDGEIRSRYFRINLDQDDGINEYEWSKYAKIFELAQNNLIVIKPGKLGELTSSDVLWQYNRGLPYVPSPLVYEGVVYLIKEGGIITTLDAATGKPIKQGRAKGPGAYFASPVAGDGKVYLASDKGVVTVLEASKSWSVISSHDFGERICATPVIDGGQIILRTGKAVYAIRKP